MRAFDKEMWCSQWVLEHFPKKTMTEHRSEREEHVLRLWGGKGPQMFDK